MNAEEQRMIQKYGQESGASTPMLVSPHVSPGIDAVCDRNEDVKSCDSPAPLSLSKLAIQDLQYLDVEALTPLTPEVISRQATINIGTIGHVAHAKSTIVKAISGVKTTRHKKEL